jgi:hypothetical protein
MIPTLRPEDRRPARIVNDAVIASVNVGDGRLIPLVIIDTSDRSDLEELVRVQRYLPPGDVTCQWGRLKGSEEKMLSLNLHFVKPAEAMLILEFDIVRQGVIVDQILMAKGLFIQPGREGDRLSTKLKAERLLVEVPDIGFGELWEDMFYKNLVTNFRRKGLSRQQSKQGAKELIEQWRKFGRFRMPIEIKQTS